MSPKPSAPTQTDTWQEALTRRLRALVRTGPLHRIEAGKGQRALSLEAQDLRALALRALDVTIERMGLGTGATLEEVAEALAPLVLAAEPTRSADEVNTIATLVVEALLNERGRRRAFEEPYTQVDADGAQRKRLTFRLLQEVRSPDGDVLLRATDEGVNIYAGMLEYPVEDAQIAEEAVLQSQVRRGRIADAVRTARRARLRSIEYEQKLLRILETTRRNVHEVRWVEEVLGMLGDARGHIEERLRVEGDLVRAVEVRLESASEESGPELVELREVLEECYGRHLDLQTRLTDANQHYLDEQDRQAFRPLPAMPMPDLEAEVFDVALGQPSSQGADNAATLLRLLTAPTTPTLVQLDALVLRLLAPRRERRDERHELFAPDLEDLHFDHRRFDESERAQVEALLRDHALRVGSLGGLLELARALGLSLAARHLLVLEVLLAFGKPDAALSVEAANRPLHAEEARGDELVFSPGTP